MCVHSQLWNIPPPPQAEVGRPEKPGVARLISQTHSPRRRVTGRAAGYHPWLRGGDLRAFQGGQGALGPRNAPKRKEFHEAVVV